MLHTYNITPIAKILLSFWFCRLHCVITKVDRSFSGITYVCGAWGSVVVRALRY